MAQKLNAKNLSYVATPPPFLAALHAQAAGRGGPDPIASGRRRAAKKRSGSEEAEDMPLVVDEKGNTVALSVGRDGIVVAEGQRQQPDDDVDGPREKAVASKGQESGAGAGARAKIAPDGESSLTCETESRMSIGGRKRKAGRAIVGTADAGAETSAAESRDTLKKGQTDVSAGKSGKLGATKKAKKAKKIKLSFDQD